MGTFQIPVDSSQETSGGSRMLMRISHLDDSSTSPTNQRQHNAVYQTPGLRSPDPARDGQTGWAASRRLRENDANRPVLADSAALSLSTALAGALAVGNAVER